MSQKGHARMPNSSHGHSEMARNPLSNIHWRSPANPNSPSNGFCIVGGDEGVSFTTTFAGQQLFNDSSKSGLAFLRCQKSAVSFLAVSHKRQKQTLELMRRDQNLLLATTCRLFAAHLIQRAIIARGSNQHNIASDLPISAAHASQYRPGFTSPLSLGLLC